MTSSIEDFNFIHSDLREKLVNIDEINKNFNNNLPFKYLYFEKFFNEKILDEIKNNWPQNPDININTDVNKRSFYRENLPQPVQKIINFLAEPKFLNLLESLTGFDNLLTDPEMENGGLHETFDGGYLGLHIDNLLHSQKNKIRVLNLIIYLSEFWSIDNYGELILSSIDGNIKKTVSPLFNSAVLFEVNKNNLHGAPSKFKSSNLCKSRKSIALFYYQKIEGKLDLSTRTHWKYKNKFQPYGEKSDYN